MEGKIRSLTEATTTFDEDGNPVVVPNVFESDIPCKYVSANKNDVVSVGDGTFTQANYIITIKDMSFTAKQIQLFNSKGVLICKKNIMVLEVLESIKRVKITI